MFPKNYKNNFVPYIHCTMPFRIYSLHLNELHVWGNFTFEAKTSTNKTDRCVCLPPKTDLLCSWWWYSTSTKKHQKKRGVRGKIGRERGGNYFLHDTNWCVSKRSVCVDRCHGNGTTGRDNRLLTVIFLWVVHAKGSFPTRSSHPCGKYWIFFLFFFSKSNKKFLTLPNIALPWCFRLVWEKSFAGCLIRKNVWRSYVVIISSFGCFCSFFFIIVIIVWWYCELCSRHPLRMACLFLKLFIYRLGWSESMFLYMENKRVLWKSELSKFVKIFIETLFWWPIYLLIRIC